MHRALAVSLVLVVAACQKGGGDQPSPAPATADDPHAGEPPTDPHAGHGHADVPQIAAPFDVKTPPADATKLPSGIAYKMIVEGTGATPGRNDGVRVFYTAWRQDGTTLATTEPSKTPVDMFLHETAGGFVDGMQLMKVGGKAMFWLPPELAEPGAKKLPEQLAYQVELVEVIAAPPVPDDVGKPAAGAKAEKSGVKWKKLKATKGDKPRGWDKVALSYSGWDREGRLLESSVMKGKPLELPIDSLPPVFADAVPQLAVGERARLWIPEKLLGKAHGAPPTDDFLCFDVELHGVTRLNEPPAAPPDVAAPPADALKTPKGVSYKVLQPGAGGPKPKPMEKVKVDYTGWTTDGKRFDSSIPEGAPKEFAVTGVIAGWTDVILMMSVGDKWRVWVPEELAYKGAPQRPAGMLVFDMELVEIIGDKVQFTPPP